MRNNKSKLEGKKEKILELGEKGYTYKQIKNAIGCSLGTISYHLGDGQKEKYLNRLRKNKPSSRERKEEYVYSQKANKPCSVCKGVFDAAAMDFHHKDRKTKFHSIKSTPFWETKYYWILSLSLSFILPFLLGCLFGRPLGGLLWGGVLRVTLVHHFTFFINSFCHFLGKKDYELDTTAKDSWFMAFFTFGEGYHNYHHKFQWDYRNGNKWYNFDPSKWIIKTLSIFNITYDLKIAQEHNIIRARLDTLNKKIHVS